MPQEQRGESTVTHMRRGCVTVLLVVMTALFWLAPRSYASNAADGFARLAKRDFAQAQSELAFGMKLPRPLPRGFRLVHVNWIGPTQVTLVWQRPGDNAYVQAWETTLTSDELASMKGVRLSKLAGRDGCARSAACAPNAVHASPNDSLTACSSSYQACLPSKH